MSVKSKHSSLKSSIGTKKKTLEDSEDDIESSEEELDLTKECHPIGFYINDRAEMINQMFSVIRGNKLKAMLPPILKDCDTEQLKLQCLDQLLGMSEKRITCILEGETLETSSESDIDSDDCDSDGKNGTTSGSSSERSCKIRDEGCLNNVHGKVKKRKGDFVSEGKAGKLSKTQAEPVEQGKTLLEILELEMRARAIRALLKQSGNEKGSDQQTEEPKAETNGDKEVEGEIVDLTECEDEDLLGCVKKEKTEEEDFDKKVSKFEEKIEKSKSERGNQPEDEKSKKLHAELELRNKLFKKKIYRTRQQRMENEEEEKKAEKVGKEEIKQSETEEVAIKKEPEDVVEEVVVEDPEEGEISTSEDEYPVEIKLEPPELVEKNIEDDFEAKIDEDAERVTAIDNGTFVRSATVENILAGGEERETEPNEGGEFENGEGGPGIAEEVRREENRETQVEQPLPVEDESEAAIESTSWRDRWLQNDGVQKLVKSSKIYAKVKKRIAEKSQRAKEEVPTIYEASSDSNSNSKLDMIEGSIEEYERLLGKNQGSQREDDTNKNENSLLRTNESK